MSKPIEKECTTVFQALNYAISELCSAKSCLQMPPTYDKERLLVECEPYAEHCYEHLQQVFKFINQGMELNEKRRKRVAGLTPQELEELEELCNTAADINYRLRKLGFSKASDQAETLEVLLNKTYALALQESTLEDNSITETEKTLDEDLRREGNYGTGKSSKC